MSASTEQPNRRRANDTTSDEPEPAAQIDVPKAGETQIWTFASWEPDFSKLANPVEAVQSAAQFPLYHKLFGALFQHLRTAHISKLDREPPQSWHTLKVASKIVSEPFSRSMVKFGRITECLWPFLDEDERNRQREAGPKPARAYLNYIMATSASLLKEQALSEGLHFAPTKQEDVQVILGGSNIPRTINTPKEIVNNIGLYGGEGKPTAWGLLGKDANISS